MTATRQSFANPTKAIVAASVDLHGDSRAVGRARDFICRHWQDRSDSEFRHDAALVVSELVSNAVKHTKSGRGGTVTVVFKAGTGWASIEVLDDGSASCPELTTQNTDEEALEISGRGLSIVAALAADFGWSPQHAPDGRNVWARLEQKAT